VDATANIDDTPSVQCRRRPRHQRCAGIVMSYLSADKNESIHWYCPVCSDNVGALLERTDALPEHSDALSEHVDTLREDVDLIRQSRSRPRQSASIPKKNR
jgi:hypothetical protein